MLDELSQHLSVERVAVEPSAMIPLHYAFACRQKTPVV